MLGWIIATIVAFFVKGLCGFADGLIFGTMLSFADNNVTITPVATLMSLPSNMILAWKNRKCIRLSYCLPVIAVLLIGDTFGAFLLPNLDTRLLKVIFGLVIAGLGIEMFLRERSSKKANASPALMVIVGVLAGIVCGLFGVGALLTAYFSRVTDRTDSFKGNICFVFAIEVIYRLGIYLLTGILTLQILERSLMLCPVMLAALFLGIYSGKVLSEKTARKIVILMLIVSGLALVLTNL